MATPSILKTPKTTRFPSSSKPLQSNFMSKVRVVLFVRSFLPSEILDKTRNPISCVSLLNPEWGSANEVVVHLKDQETSRNECYKLDSFYGQDDTAIKIFEQEVSPLIPGIFNGWNATVFAYGATGSGKTHTMQGTDELPGLMPLAMSMVLSMCENSGSSAEISYYEVYMDRCYDLLEPKAKEVSVLDDKDGQVQLRGLSRVHVGSMSEFDQVFSCGIQRRKVAHTGLNDISSRSHGVLVIVVSSPSHDGSGSFVTGKLNLIDLAGNEDNRRTCNDGIRLQESSKINQSLFTLSNVIYALNNNKSHVPYRESKLTRILQDSLGGTSRSLMIACLNPGEYQESVYTVSLAARSRQISNYVSSDRKEVTPKVKIDMEAKLQAWLESKGKTKSAHRMGALGSPLFNKTPIPTSSIKKPIFCHTSAKRKATNDQCVSNAKERNLSNSDAPVFSSTEIFMRESYCSNAPTVGPELVTNEDCLHNVEDCQKRSDTMQDGGFETSEDQSCKDVVTPPREENHLNSYNMTGNNGTEEHKEDKANSGGTSVLESITSFCDDNSLEKEKTPSNPAPNSMGSPSISDIRALQKSLRKVLSPINSNINTKPLEDLPSKDGTRLVFFEPKDPKTPYVLNTEKDIFQATNTPLDKFNARSSNLKSSLAQDYVAFLNSASKEELLKLKGIGHKRADSILQLRETTPLKSLCDLENIGLSSKQVKGIFRRAAKGIFDQVDQLPYESGSNLSAYSSWSTCNTKMDLA